MSEHGPDIYQRGKVIEFEGYRVERGRRIGGYCEHKRFVIVEDTNQVQCRECGEILDPFWALCRYSDWQQDWLMHIKSRLMKIDDREAELKDLENQKLHFIAAKHIEKRLRDHHRVPTCPHCGEALLGEDLLNVGEASRELVMQKRKAKEKTT